MTHIRERMREVAPKRRPVEANHRELGMCGKSWNECAGVIMALGVAQLLVKGDKLCPECSAAHTALLRRNDKAYWQWKEY